MPTEAIHPRREVVKILLVDDSRSDAKLVMQFAKRAQIANPITHVESGPAALSYLESAEALPGLILLDLNMPVMNGHEVLMRIRCHSNPGIASVPVVILTTSDNPDEVRAAYSENANSYIVKPIDIAGFSRIMKSLAEYWFEIVKNPSVND